MIPLRSFGSAHVPMIGLGTWNMEKDNRSQVFSAIRRAVELGLTHIDTAELYGDGEVESMLGEALGGLRERVFLVSKVLPENATRRGTIAACERSLRRLRTDHLDSYLLHWGGDHPLSETIAAFTQLQEQGKIRSWGVSNFDVHELEAAEQIAGPGKIACNQVLYHLQERSIEHAVLPWCEAHGVALVGYSPFGSGDFPDPESPGGHALSNIAARHDASPYQIALAFLTRRPSLLTIPKSSRVAGVEDNAAAARITLTERDLATLERAFPAGAPADTLPTI